VLRNIDGKLITTLEKAMYQRLVATGWKPVTPVQHLKRMMVKQIFMA
jgi:hypothetical protein